MFFKKQQVDMDLHAGYVMIEGHKIDNSCTYQDIELWFPHFHRAMSADGGAPCYSGPCEVRAGDFTFGRVEFVFNKRDDGTIYFSMMVLHTGILFGKERKKFFKIARPWTCRPQVVDTSWGFQMDNGTCLFISRDESPAFISIVWE